MRRSVMSCTIFAAPTSSIKIKVLGTEDSPHLIVNLDLAVEDLAREPVLRDAEVHHAARHRAGLVDGDRVSHQAQVPRDRQPARLLVRVYVCRQTES